MNDNLTISTFQLFERYPNAESARVYFEERRWHGHVVCPHCGSDDRISARSGKRIGYYRCGDCKEEFTVRTSTIFERSHVPLHKWLYAMYFVVTSRKDISSLQLSKQISVTQKTSWFMLGRLREACGGDYEQLKGVVDVDEAYVGGKEGNKHKSKRNPNDGRGPSGQATSSRNAGARRQDGGQAIDGTDSATLHREITKHVELGSAVYTNEHRGYNGLEAVCEQGTVNHGAGEYIGANDIHTNSIESVWAVLKRGLYGAWHKVSGKHLHRYVDETTFRLNEGNMKIHATHHLTSFVDRTFKHRITYKGLVA